MIKKVGMIVKYNIFGYLIGEGFGNVFKNKKSTGASLMIMCATMIIFGIFLILTDNINHFVAEVESAQGIQVFIVNQRCNPKPRTYILSLSLKKRGSS